MKLIARLDCAGSNCACPSVYKTDNGTFIIQGTKVDEAKRNQLNIPQNEEIVEVPEELLKKL